uniref:hypothetical protein n=1 Tax=Stenotrophomonas sp. PS02300 TaxID=2991426 RepID=UPI00249C5CE5
PGAKPGGGSRAGAAAPPPHARRPIGPADIRWADVILVMEPKHLHRLQAGFPRLLAYKRLHCLDIADDYRYMDPQLVELIDTKVTSLLRGDGQAG